MQRMPEGYTRIEINEKWGKEITVEEAQQICKAIHDVNEGNPSFDIVVGTNATGVTMKPGVLQEFSKNEWLNKVRIVEAQVFNSLSQRILIHMYHKLNKTKNFKVFKTEESAVEWVLEQKKLYESGQL